MPLVLPKSGRACVRTLQGGSAIVGVMHFDDDLFFPKELASYPLAYSSLGSEVAISTEMLHDDCILGYKPVSLSDFEKVQAVWHSEIHADMRMDSVRFVSLRGSENSYAFLSISRDNPFAQHPSFTLLKDSPHFFVTFQDGYAMSWEQPEVPQGMPLMGLLRDLPIWPDPQGLMKTASDLSSYGREVFDRLHELHLRKVSNSIDDATYIESIRPFNLYTTANVIQDSNFCQFIKLTHEYGMHRPSGHLYSEADQAVHSNFLSAAARAIINKTIDSPRTHERLESISGNDRTALTTPLRNHTITKDSTQERRL